MQKLVKAAFEFAVRRWRLVVATFVLSLVGGLVAWHWYRTRQVKDDAAAESLVADLASDSERLIRATASLPAENDLSRLTNWDEQYRDVRHSLLLTIERFAEFRQRDEAIRWAHSQNGTELTHAMLAYAARADYARKGFDDRLKLLAALIGERSRDGAAGQSILVRLRIDPTAKPGELPYSRVTLASFFAKMRVDRSRDFDAYFTGKRARLLGRVTRVEQAGGTCRAYLNGLEYKEVRMVFEPDQVVSDGGIPVARGTCLFIEGTCGDCDKDMVVFTGCRVVEGYRDLKEGLDALDWWEEELKAGRRPEKSPFGRAAAKK